MDKVRAIRHSVKSVLAAAAILSAAFVTLHMFRPDVAAKLTGVKYDNNSASEKTFFEALLGTGKDKSIRASDRNLKGISSDWLSSERSRNSGSATSRRSLLQRQYADLAYGNALSAKQYVPFTYQDTTTTGFVSQSTGDATRRKTVHKPTTSRNQTGMARRHRTVETMAPPAAITEPASAPGRQFATINRVEIRSDKDKPTELAETFKALGEKIALGKSKAQSSRDDAEIAILLLEKAGKDIRLAPAALSAAATFLKIHPVSPETKIVEAALKEFRTRHGAELKRRSTLASDSKLRPITVGARTLEGVKNCLVTVGQISSLSIVQDRAIPGLPAYFAAANLALISGNDMSAKIAKCLAPFFAKASVTIITGRFGAEGRAAEQISAVENSKIFWTGFASLGTTARKQ